jgi:uncharacterized membrane protein YqjE
MPEITPPRSADQPNLGELLESTLHHAKDLLQAELALAKSEVSNEVSSALDSLVLLVVGAIFLEAALTTLGVLLVFAFGVSVAAVAVVLVLTALGAIFCLVAKRGLERRKLPRTAARLALDTRQVMETVK